MRKTILVMFSILFVFVFTSCNDLTMSQPTNVPSDPNINYKSSIDTEYLVPHISKTDSATQVIQGFINLDYNKQWLSGDWRPVKSIETSDVRRTILNIPRPWEDLTDHGSKFIYDCIDYYTWNRPPPTRNNIKGTNNKESVVEPDQSIKTLPSIYRQFIKTSSISSMKIKIWGIGSTDVYIDPPSNVALVQLPSKTNNPWYIGHAEAAENQLTTLIFDKVYPGTHCLYFVHKSHESVNFFGICYEIMLESISSQLSDGGWTITEGNCACAVSNASAQTLEHENDWSNIVNSGTGSKIPKGIDLNQYKEFNWDSPNGTPVGSEWQFGTWNPISVISCDQADNLSQIGWQNSGAWGAATKGTPWHKQYNKGACWIYSPPHQIPGSSVWNKERGWKNTPLYYTNIYRQTFSVDKNCTADLSIYTNDIVDVYLDPIEDKSLTSGQQWWYSNTPIIWQGHIPNPPRYPGFPSPSYYYLGRADKQTRGMIIPLQNLLTPGTHTLYFIHRNDTEIAANTSYLKMSKKTDYFGFLFTLCCRENCPCTNESTK